MTEYPKGTKEEIEFMQGLCDEFKVFVVGAVEHGSHNRFDDHFEFLKYFMKQFEKSKNAGETK